MNVSEAVQTRYSARAFLHTPVDRDVLESILLKARQSPSGGNLQPWHVHVLRDNAMSKFKQRIARELLEKPTGETPEYAVYPPKLKEPYRSRRYKCGEDLYASINISREDKPARLRQFANNYCFFGAPVALMVAVDRVMGPPQFSDLGMYLMSVMLLAREQGLHTCGQESWASWHRVITEHLALPPEHMLFCGLAIGHADDSQAINQWRTDRAPSDEILTWHD